MGPESEVPSHLRSIHAMSFIESIEVGTHHFKGVPKYDRDVTWQHFLETRAGLVPRVWSSQQSRHKSRNFFAWNNEDPTLTIINPILIMSSGPKDVTLPSCWDLLIWVGLGTSYPTWIGLECIVKVGHVEGPQHISAQFKGVGNSRPHHGDIIFPIAQWQFICLPQPLLLH